MLGKLRVICSRSWCEMPATSQLVRAPIANGASMKSAAEIPLRASDLAPFSYPIGIRVSAWVMPSWAVVAAIRGAEPSVERSVADRRAAA